MKFFKPIILISVVCLLMLFGSRYIRSSGGETSISPASEQIDQGIPVRTEFADASSSTETSQAVNTPEAGATNSTAKKAVLILRDSTSSLADVVIWNSCSPAAKRAQKIVPDSSWMTPDPVLKTGDLIELALFDDAVFSARISNVTRYPNGSVGMTAHLQDGQNGEVYLSYCDGALRASVEALDGANFVIRYRPEQKTHYALEVDPANTIVLKDADSAVPDIVADSSNSADAIAVADGVPGAPSGSTIVDVMIVYTPAALAYEGSLANMNNNIALAMQQANAAHTNSNTQVYLNLVHSEEVNYTEVDYSADLNNLTYSNGSYSAVDEVHMLRDQYSADLVCLFKTDPTYGGYGWVLNDPAGNPSYAFCWVNIRQSDSRYTTAHEWGHNMGCGHSKSQTFQPGPGLYSYSAGWQWNDLYPPAAYRGDYVGYCSVMTYQDFDNDGKSEYIRVPYFSNPSITYTDGSTRATGDAANGDNARTIRETRAVVAAYRKAPDLDYDGLPNKWETQYFGGETNANPTTTASNGVNTVLQCYIAGLNPTSAASFFKVTGLEKNGVGNGFVVRWSAVSGRVYSVYSASNLLLNNFQNLATNLAFPQSSYTDSVYQAGQFYKIDVRLAP